MLKQKAGEKLAGFFDSRYERSVIKIKPGEYAATTRPYIIATVLGSCVAACIRDPVRGGAGMNHFMLPAPHDTQARTHRATDADALRYGAFAMESLINEFIKHGSKRRDLVAKVFGGSTLMPFMYSDIGKQNAEFVVDYLATEGIRLEARDLGGTHPRKVLLFVDTGTVLVKHLALENDEVREIREIEARPLALDRKPSTVELF